MKIIERILDLPIFWGPVRAAIRDEIRRESTRVVAAATQQRNVSDPTERLKDDETFQRFAAEIAASNFASSDLARRIAARAAAEGRAP